MLPGISPSTTAQVVHSAGRRFIVSPVPESRLREQFFGNMSNTSFGDDPTPATSRSMNLSLSAPSAVLQEGLRKTQPGDEERNDKPELPITEQQSTTVICSEPRHESSSNHYSPESFPSMSSNTFNSASVTSSTSTSTETVSSPPASMQAQLPAAVAPALPPSTTSQTSAAPGSTTAITPTPQIPASVPANSAAPNNNGIIPVPEQQPFNNPSILPLQQPSSQSPSGTNQQPPPSLISNLESEGPEVQTKTGGDIEALDKKLRSLFKDPPSTTSTSVDPSQSTGTSSPPAGTSSPPPGPALVPPSNLPLTSGTPLPTPGHAQTPPTKPRAQTLPVGFDPSATPLTDLVPFPGPNQQPLNNLDAQLRRALSPETIQGSTAVPNQGTGFTLGRFQVSVAADPSVSVPDASSAMSSSSITSSCTSSSSTPSSPENTLHRSSGLSKELCATDQTNGGPVSSAPSSECTETIGRFQVSTSSSAPLSGSKVGRFSVTVSSAPAADHSTSHGSSLQNGPSSSPSDPHNTHTPCSSDNDDSETEDEGLQKEISRLREKHMLEIQALQMRQQEEINALFACMGKCAPTAILSPAVAMAGVRRRLKSKTHKSVRSSGLPSTSYSGTLLFGQNMNCSETLPKKDSEAALEMTTEALQAVYRASTLTSSSSMPTLGSTDSAVTTSTNGSGHVHSYPLAGSSASLSQKTKGTFTDDLHQLVDNFARDAIKRVTKAGGQAVHDTNILPANMGRKFSAPGYLCPSLPTTANTTCSTSSQMPNQTNPSPSVGSRKGSVGPVAQGFSYTSSPYNAPQWAGPTGTSQVNMIIPTQSLAQYQPNTTVSVSLQQGYHIGTSTTPLKPNSGGTNLRPT